MKKKYIALSSILLLLLSFFIYWKFNWTDTKIDSYEWEDIISTVEKRWFDSNIEVSWTTKIKNEQKLRFNTTGKITEVKFNVWDTVRLWETLAEIDKDEIYNEIERAKLSLNTSKVRLNNFLDSLNKTWIKKADLDLESINSQIIDKEASLNFLLSKQKNDLLEKELSLKEEANNYKILEKETVKNISTLNLTDEDREKIINDKQLELSKERLDFNKFENDFDDNLKKKINEYYNSLEENYYWLKTQLINWEKNLKKVNEILWINKSKFNYYEYFSAKETSNRNMARKYYHESSDNFNKFNEEFKNINSKKDIKNIIIALETSKTFNESFYNLNNYMVKWFEQSIETSWFSSWDISWYSSEFSSFMSDSKNKLTSVNSIIDELKTTTWIDKIEADLQDELKLRKNNIEKLELEIKKINDNQNFIVDTSTFSIEIENIKLEKTKKSLETQLLELEKFKVSQVEELKQEKIALERLKLDLIDIEKRKKELEKLNSNGEYVWLKNEVKQNEVNLSDSYKKLENYIIQAPFDWIITKVDFKPWDRLNSDTEKYISIVDPNTIEVKTFVNQSDIVKINKWALTNLELWAYPDVAFSWIVSEVETTPIEVNWISKFELKVLLNNPENLKLYSWMKAIVKIKYDTIPEWLVVPFTSVSTDNDWNKFVTLINNWNKEKRIVEVWYTDWKYYQIISWLVESDKILEIDYNSDLFKWNMFDSFEEDEEWESVEI